MHHTVLVSRMSSKAGAFGRRAAAALVAALLCFWLSGQIAPRVTAQSQSEISSPATGSSISGDVPIMGTAVIEPFQKYELHYKLEPSGDDAYIYFDGATSPVQGGQLGTWRASALPPGTYSLRLRVVKADGNYAEFFSPSISVNQGPAPTPTSDEPTPTPIPTATFTPAPQPTVAVGNVEQPALENPLVPTATPTATPESLAVAIDPEAAAEGDAAVADAATEGSVTRELGEALGVERLREAFATGARFSAMIFLVIGLIYLVRWLLGTLRTRSA